MVYQIQIPFSLRGKLWIDENGTGGVGPQSCLWFWGGSLHARGKSNLLGLAGDLGRERSLRANQREKRATSAWPLTEVQ